MNPGWLSAIRRPAWPQPGRLPRVRELDGWRGISILCVVAAHMFPLGPAWLRFNYASGLLGMSLFFTLSGFLITSTLIYHPNTRDFLIRRFFRIIPLAWLVILVVLTLVHAPLRIFASNLLFYSNVPPFPMSPITAHLWSLCVEVHFYLFVALLFAIWGRSGLLGLPLAGLAITLLRVATGTHMSIVTWLRVDEIFAGGTLALIYEGILGQTVQTALRRIPIPVWFLLLFMSCHPAFRFVSYFRPYCAAGLIGSTIFQAKSFWSGRLRASWLVYVAGISYAIYVLHLPFTFGWFAPASRVAVYERRPIALALIWLLAHLSTRYYESYWIRVGKRLIHKRQPGDAGLEEDRLRASPATP